MSGLQVLYLGGMGRSGSTVYERMLAQLPGHVAVGELVHLWDRGLRDDERCGCGVAFSRCDYWQAVGAHAFGGWHRLDLPRVQALKRRVDRKRHLPKLAAPQTSPRFAAELEEYAGLLSAVYAAVGVVSGAQVVVDAGKHLSTAYLLRHVAGIDYRLVHYVRSPHGVVHSWTKPPARRPDPTRGADFMATNPAARVAAEWVVENALFERLRRRGVPTVRVRYEDVTTDPAAALQAAAALLERPLPAGALGFLQVGAADLPSTHTVAGHPMRFVTGRVTFRADESWRQAMPVRRRRLVTLSTWPVGRRYGYPVGTGLQGGRPAR